MIAREPTPEGSSPPAARPERDHSGRTRRRHRIRLAVQVVPQGRVGATFGAPRFPVADDRFEAEFEEDCSGRESEGTDVESGRALGVESDGLRSVTPMRSLWSLERHSRVGSLRMLEAPACASARPIEAFALSRRTTRRRRSDATRS